MWVIIFINDKFYRNSYRMVMDNHRLDFCIVKIVDNIRNKLPLGNLRRLNFLIYNLKRSSK